jgi:hypothetical protein
VGKVAHGDRHRKCRIECLQPHDVFTQLLTLVGYYVGFDIRAYSGTAVLMNRTHSFCPAFFIIFYDNY